MHPRWTRLVFNLNPLLDEPISDQFVWTISSCLRREISRACTTRKSEQLQALHLHYLVLVLLISIEGTRGSSSLSTRPQDYLVWHWICLSYQKFTTEIFVSDDKLEFQTGNKRLKKNNNNKTKTFENLCRELGSSQHFISIQFNYDSSSKLPHQASSKHLNVYCLNGSMCSWMQVYCLNGSMCSWMRLPESVIAWICFCLNGSRGDGEVD